MSRFAARFYIELRADAPNEFLPRGPSVGSIPVRKKSRLPVCTSFRIGFQWLQEAPGARREVPSTRCSALPEPGSSRRSYWFAFFGFGIHGGYSSVEFNTGLL